MKKFILNKLIGLITISFPQYTETELAKIRYGLEGIYITITKTIIIFGIAYLLNIVKGLLVIVVFYNFLRIFSFGLHASKSTSCLIASTVFFIGSAYLCQFVNIGPIIKLFISAVTLITFIKYAPADTSKRPIICKKRRDKYKLLSTLIVIIYIFILFFSKKQFLNNSLIFSMIFQSFLITPFCYSIFDQSYNNFLYWEGGVKCEN